MLRSLRVPVKVPAALCRENLGMIICCTNLDLDLKNKHVVISYHKLGESAAARIVNPFKVCTTVNRYDILTKGVLAVTMGSFSDDSYGVDWGEK